MTPSSHQEPAPYVVAELCDESVPIETIDYPELTEQHLRLPRRRRIGLPVLLFVITCVSTFWIGALGWEQNFLFTPDVRMNARMSILRHWDQGMIYMACVLAILLAHEMGHFLTTLRYRIPASMPYFIPMPFSPIGTMGAVIGMDGLRANRRELFDIGLAGPITGLVVALPILFIGITKLNMNQPGFGTMAFDMPLLVNMLLYYVKPDGYVAGPQIWSTQNVWTSQLNPYFMAGWVGLLITGLNMLPISQLDGGHVVYTLFGKSAHWVGRIFLFIAILFIVFADARIWILMVIIVILIGTDHPPTSDDSVPLGAFRTVLGYASLLIPIMCFPPHGISAPGL